MTKKPEGEHRLCDAEIRKVTGRGFHWLSVSSMLWWNWAAFRFEAENSSDTSEQEDLGM